MNTQIETTPLTHLTLNTGHIACTSGITPPEELAAVQPLLKHGGPIPTRYPYWVELVREPGSASFAICCGANPVTLNVLVWEDTAAPAAWAAVEHLYLKLSDRHPEAMEASAWPEQPVLTPWLATLVLPGFAFLPHPMDAMWIGAFERIYAEALLAEVAA